MSSNREYTITARNQIVGTSINGMLSLINYYHYAKQYRNCWINLNLDGVNFIDANLSAFLYSIVYDLKNNFGVSTFIDFKSIGKDLNVLMRNGFTNHVAGNGYQFKPYDERDTTIPLMVFNQKNVDDYCDYIERDFLHQRGLRNIRFNDKDRIIASYIEIFENVGLHANTNDPVFVCGQYFPKQGELKFTLVDLGDGFLKKIAEYTKGDENITTASDAIHWAIAGHSTKIGAPGGTGLRDIFRFCTQTGGSLHIMSDDCYYNLTNTTTHTYKLLKQYKGATIHLIFRFLL
ncbi:MAG TPA: hypothetical protein VMV56_06520 [Williamwhitmania sp.]|nr:hypothetical protein [Williamwhitmania sp.]